MKAVIICNGEPPRRGQVAGAMGAGVRLIAADGGALVAAALGLEPDIIIGDLDSYNVTGDERACVIHDPDPETNDLEKALGRAVSESVSEAIIFGATGKRLDHTLKNLSVLKRFRQVFKTLVIRDRYADIFLADSPFRRELPLRTPVSFFPLSGRVDGITTRGLKYPLTNESLENGVRDGSSNLSIEPTVEVTFETGDLLFLIHHDVRGNDQL